VLHALTLTGYKSGALRGTHKKDFASPKVTHPKVPHYTEPATALWYQLLDISKEHTLKLRFKYSL